MAVSAEPRPVCLNYTLRIADVVCVKWDCPQQEIKFFSFQF